MEYVTVVEGARRLGISEKTIRRAIHAGKLPARYPHKNRCEIAVHDLEGWRQPRPAPNTTDDRLAELEHRLQQLEQQVQKLADAQRVTPAPGAQKLPQKTKQPAQVETLLLDNLVSLQSFADQHFVSRNEAEQRWSMGLISGSRQGAGKRAPIMIGDRGKDDFWVQFHETSGFRACDNCPHHRK